MGIIKNGAACAALMLGSLSCFAPLARGATIPVQNYSFEDGYVGGGVGTYGDGKYYTQGTIPGWTWSNNFNPNDTGLMEPGPNNSFADADGNLIAPAEGKFLAWAGSTDSSNPLLTYTGTSLGTFVAGQTYTLTAALGLPATQGNQLGQGAVELTAAGVVVASHSEPTPARGTIEDVSVTYTATAADEGKAIGIIIAQSAYYAQDAIDNVRLATSVPEPASAGLLAMGAMGLLGRRKRS